ncbi:MAG: MarR family transcriptional regulator [candidate division Zixibacteria bacterium]|nr:MarR family transcriptional regulator [candidate division Zixibacteria bacterium]
MKDKTKAGTGLPPAVERINRDGNNVESQTHPPKNGAYNLHILRSLRRIVRAIDLYSRELKASCGLTVPQLVCLSAIVREKQITAVALSLQVNLSPSTLVGILDRLEKGKLIRRVRSVEDRRQVIINATDAGKNAVRKAPSPLQENLAMGLGSLPANEQATIAQSLDKVVEFMEAHEIKVAPLLTLERKSYAGKPVMKRE